MSNKKLDEWREKFFEVNSRYPQDWEYWEGALASEAVEISRLRMALRAEMSKPQSPETCPLGHPMWALKEVVLECANRYQEYVEKTCSLCAALAAGEREGLLKAVKVICPACSAGRKVTRVTSKITGRTLYYHEGLANCQASDIHHLIAEAGKR